MTTTKNQWNLLGDQDKIELNYDFDNQSAQTLMNLFNDTTPKLLKLIEKREFLTYFYMGTSPVPLLTAKQAMDFKTTFNTTNFPANGIQAYIDWLNTDSNNYINAFPYSEISMRDKLIKYGTWKVGYIDSIVNDIADICNNQHNYGSWLDKIINGQGWDGATEELPNYEGFMLLASKLVGLFATGKFIDYYNRYVQGAIETVLPGVAFEFDPYTGNMLIGSPNSPQYNGPFSGLMKETMDAAKILLTSHTNTSGSRPLENHHRFFLLLCEWIGSGYDKSETAKEYDGSPITSYWDFSPVQSKNGRPYNSFIKDPAVIVNSKMVTNIRNLTAQFMKQTRTINKGSTSYKDYWNGADLKLPKGEILKCPFFFVIHVDFDSLQESKNPFKGEALTAINNMINETLAYREALMNKINSAFRNVTVNRSCSSVINNSGTVIMEEGSVNPSMVIEAGCSIEHIDGENEKGEKEEANEPQKEVEAIDDAVVETSFIVNGTDVSEDASTAQSGGKGEKGDKGADGKDCSPLNPVTITLIALIALLTVAIIGYGIYIYKLATGSIKNKSGYSEI